MNGKIKFRKATGPAFAPGEVWVSSSGAKVTIVSVSLYKYAANLPSPDNADYAVTYAWVEHGSVVQHTKDAWNFQVRYTHIADTHS